MSSTTSMVTARAPDLPDIPLFGGVTVGQVFVAVAAVVVPATVLGHVLVIWAWARGWEPHRLRTVALVVVAAAVLAGPVVGTVPWWGAATAVGAVRQAWDGHYLPAGIDSAAATAPLVAITSWAWWHLYTKRMRSGVAQAAGERHVRRQLHIRAGAAARRARRERTPLASHGRDGTPSVVLGPRYDTVRAQPDLLTDTLRRRAAPWLQVPMPAIALHAVCLAETGAGKTTMLVRCSGSWAEITWTAYNQQQHGAAGSRPLVIFLAAKGGPDADTDAHEWADALEELGLSPDRIGVFPFETRLNMWRMPATQLRAALHKLAKTDHRFYDVLQRGLLHLIIDAPTEKPPASSAEFLQRLDPAWLAAAWAGHPVEERAIAALTKTTGVGAGASSLDSDLLLFADLFRSIGGDFDAGQPLSDFDALYVSVPGATDQVVAATKTAVLIELLTYELGVAHHGQRRQVLFVIDEFSAVSGDTAGDVINLVERLRSLGGSVIVSAQSYEGLADTEDQRRRLLGAMGGGALLGRTSNAEALAERFGTRLVDEVGYQLDGGRMTGVGTIRRQHTYLLDPNRLRQLPRHHLAYATPDQVIYGVVAPLTAAPAIVGSPRRTAPTDGPALSRRRLTAGQAAAINRRLRRPGTTTGNGARATGGGDGQAPDWTGDDWTHDTSNEDPR
ncbi:TraM recognition domain-containing protein [Pseudonocardia sp. ICBG601]|uniref:TraM recognition domain-containing protein n=1 Tax=Pseudonocardia sp. ICBG601 TaxID=2846759 RepID=UPI001CF67BFE|nr:TraM recognition domain-containing protein [Pseudonocardia sp. ICBG601]